MSASESHARIFVVDTNLFFVKRLSEALREQGFEVVQCSGPAYALTMIEWNTPAAILCATSFGNSAGFEIPGILRADPKTSHIPVIAVGDRGQQSQLEALRSGYADFVDRRLGAEEIASHLASFLSSRRDGFQPTQMLARSETALDGRLSLVDLPGVIQVLAQSRQTGGLHINAGAADGIIFFDAGEIIHAESGQFAGDDAIVHLVKSCYLTKDGVYKFIPGDPAKLRTVQGALNALILDALRQLDEEERQALAELGAVTKGNSTAAPHEVEPENPEEKTSAMSGQPSHPPAEIIPETTTESAPAPESVPAAGVEALEELPSEPVAALGRHAEAMPTSTAVSETRNEIETVSSLPQIVEEVDHSVSGTVPFLDPEKFACESIIDEDTLRELNDLLSGLKVEEQESHE